MAVSEGYRTFIVEQLSRVTPVTAKSMFGGVGLYARGRFFALVDNDVLFFKVDDATRPDFERAGMRPFQPWPGHVMPGYWELPGEVLEDVELLEKWMKLAIAVAAGGKGSKRAPKPAAGMKPRAAKSRKKGPARKANGRKR